MLKKFLVFTCCALARAKQEDIERAAETLFHAKQNPRIHVFVASSQIHVENKLRRSPDEIVGMAIAAIKKARSYVDDVEFSPEDSTRTGYEFLIRIVTAAIEAGARIINIPDTVGYAVGDEYGLMIARLIRDVPLISQKGIVLSVHCHNDLGLATMNALAGLKNGARQVECTINGIGERSGNTHFAEVVMALLTRQDYFGLNVDINTTQIGPTARLLSAIIQKPIPDTLPIVGQNVFAHSSGIHQDGVQKDRRTYEIISPEMVGWRGESFPLTSQSGRHGLQKRLIEIGYTIDTAKLAIAYQQFSNLAATKPFIHNTDLHMIMQEITAEEHAKSEHWLWIEQIDYQKKGTERQVYIKLRTNGSVLEATGCGNGPVSSVWAAIQNALKSHNLWHNDICMESYDLGKGTGGVEAFGIATIKLSNSEGVSYGRASDTDIVIASAKAAVTAINYLSHAPIKKCELTL
ncbi:MAG: 2-isopropylmalate synthase [bacterium]